MISALQDLRCPKVSASTDGVRIPRECHGRKLLMLKRHRRRVYSVSLLIGALLSLGVLANVLLARPGDCDSSLTQVNTPLGYRDRGDRCEGMYVKEVSSTTLYVASLTEVFEEYDIKSAEPLHVEWDRLPGNSSVRLRAQGLKRKLYYRMDTVQSPPTTSYVWPSNVLASLNIPKSDVGMVALARHSWGGTERDVYLPVRIRQAGKASRAGSYKLVLIPGVELVEVFLTLAATGADGQPQTYLKEREKLGYGYYPAERGVEIPIVGMKNTGVYSIQIGAKLRGGGTSTIDLWFYHNDGRSSKPGEQ